MKRLGRRFAKRIDIQIIMGCVIAVKINMINIQHMHGQRRLLAIETNMQVRTDAADKQQRQYGEKHDPGSAHRHGASIAGGFMIGQDRSRGARTDTGLSC